VPIAGPAISSAILGQFAARKFTGRNAIDIASAVGSAVANYIILPNLVSCTLSGTAGPVGSITSIAAVGLEPTAMSGLMTSKALSKKLTGRDASGLFSAISMGLFQVMSTMFLTGSSIGCAVGAGIGKFTAVSAPALSKLILAQLTLKKIIGRDAINLADCIAFGLVTQLKSSVTISVVVVGAPAPVPPVGPILVAGIPSVFTKIS